MQFNFYFVLLCCFAVNVNSNVFSLYTYLAQRQSNVESHQRGLLRQPSPAMHDGGSSYPDPNMQYQPLSNRQGSDGFDAAVQSVLGQPTQQYPQQPVPESQPPSQPQHSQNQPIPQSQQRPVLYPTERPTTVNYQNGIQSNAINNQFGIRQGSDGSNAVQQHQRQPVSRNTPFEQFNTHLFGYVAPGNAQRNIVYSPISLQTILSLVYMGATAGSPTATELQTALKIPANKESVAALFSDQKNSQLFAPEAKLIEADKIYYKNSLQLENDITRYLQIFQAEVEPTNFSPPGPAADQINNWVARKTEGRITNLVSADTLDYRTEAILVNAIYFKAKWAKEFSTSDTTTKNFFNTDQRAVPVQMMFNDETYRFGDFTDLRAKVIELPYKNSDLSMMIILPYEKNGLQTVESQLSRLNLAELSAKLELTSVMLTLPKFKIDFELDMVQPLQKLGIRKIFTDGELEGFFRGQPVIVSKIQHKATLEVNEAGSEAAAASFVKFIPLSLPARQVSFVVDHPFIFAIRGPKGVYFVGHIANL